MQYFTPLFLSTCELMKIIPTQVGMSYVYKIVKNFIVQSI